MEKLNELWLEYEATIKGVDYFDCDIRPVLEDDWENNLILISKEYGFIKWLVDNDKIELKAGPLYGFQPIMNNRKPFTLYETLLMLLSISDSPIDFLISILK